MFLDKQFSVDARPAAATCNQPDRALSTEALADNGPARLIDIFFYGLYQDPEILAQHDVEARHPRRALLRDFMLRIGNNGTLLRHCGAVTPGLLLALTPLEIKQLYADAGLHQYHPESVLVDCEDGSTRAALCYITLQAPGEQEHNPGYAERLRHVMSAWGLPTTHIN